MSHHGIPVPHIPNPMLPDVGVAHTLVNGQPVIQMNPAVLMKLPPVVQQFWFAHECAHHALAPFMNSEVNADCWAIRALRHTGVVQGPADVQVLLASIAQLPGSMQGHLPGPARAQNLFYCVNTP